MKNDVIDFDQALADVLAAVPEAPVLSKAEIDAWHVEDGKTREWETWLERELRTGALDGSW